MGAYSRFEAKRHFSYYSRWSIAPCVLVDPADFLLKRFKQETKENHENKGHDRFFSGFFWIKIATAEFGDNATPSGIPTMSPWLVLLYTPVPESVAGRPKHRDEARAVVKVLPAGCVCGRQQLGWGDSQEEQGKRSCDMKTAEGLQIAVMQPALSRGSRTSNGDISHGLGNQLSHGAPGPANGDISHGLNSQPSHGAPGPANGDISHGLSNQLSPRGSRTSQWRHFSWLKQPDLSRAPGPANGDISHGLSSQTSHGLQDQPMATFLMA